MPIGSWFQLGQKEIHMSDIACMMAVTPGCKHLHRLREGVRPDDGYSQ